MADLSICANCKHVKNRTESGSLMHSPWEWVCGHPVFTTDFVTGSRHASTTDCRVANSDGKCKTFERVASPHSPRLPGESREPRP